MNQPCPQMMQLAKNAYLDGQPTEIWAALICDAYDIEHDIARSPLAILQGHKIEKDARAAAFEKACPLKPRATRKAAISAAITALELSFG